MQGGFGLGGGNFNAYAAQNPYAASQMRSFRDQEMAQNNARRQQLVASTGNPYAGTGGPGAPMSPGPGAPDTSQEAYNMYTATSMPGPGQSTPSYEDWKTQQSAPRQMMSPDMMNQQKQGLMDGLGGMGGLGALASQRQMQGGFGPQAADTSKQSYEQQMATSQFAPGGMPSYEQWQQQQSANQGFGQQQMQQQMQQYNPYQQANPYQPQVQQQQYQNPYQSQLQSGNANVRNAFGELMNSYANPRRPSAQPPQQRYNPLAYRPNMTQANAALNRVKPSVYKSDLDAAKAKLAEYEAADAARQSEARNSYGGGGD
jgi:hypothetical protein